MEDDEEVQSHPSGASGSPGSSTPPPPSSSQRSNGRITVTVAAVPQQQQSQNNTLTLALPIQRQNQQSVTPPARATSTAAGGGGREDCWSEGATGILIDAWGERYLELSRGNLKQKHWKDVADIVSGREDYTKAAKTDIQCKNRIDTVKKKYKLEKAKIAAGGGPSKWPFYDRLDQLIGPSAKAVAGPSSTPYSETNNQRVPMGIPMGVRSAPPHPKFPQQQHQQKQKHLFRKPQQDSDEEDEDEEDSEREPSPDSAEDFPPDRKRQRNQREFVNSSGTKSGMTNRVVQRDEKGNNNNGGGGEKNWGSSVRELTQAILKFGEAYEQAETLKLQQLVEMEKQRMKFAKEMELQRMQFFMKTQLELSQIKSSSSNNSSRKVGNNSNSNHNNNNNHHHHRSSNNNNNVVAANNNNSNINTNDNNNSESSN